MRRLPDEDGYVPHQEDPPWRTDGTSDNGSPSSSSRPLLNHEEVTVYMIASTADKQQSDDWLYGNGPPMPGHIPVSFDVYMGGDEVCQLCNAENGAEALNAAKG